MLPSPLTTPAALHRAREQWPDRLAVHDHQWGTEVDLTWTQLTEQVEPLPGRWPNWASNPVTRVAIWAPNSWHWPIAALGRIAAPARSWCR